jgi:hypothetical protein
VNRLRKFGAFWYDFIVGDDWRIAVCVVVGVTLTAVLTQLANLRAWWVLPVVVLGGLTVSLRFATRQHRRGSPAGESSDSR